MEMMIDEHIAQLKKLKSFHNGSYGASINFAIDTMRKYQMFQAEYVKRLKADMVAMLTDIQISVAELDFSWLCDYADGDCIKRYAVVDIIQEKINVLKGDQQQDEKIDTSKSDQGKVY